MIPHKRNSLRN